MSTSTYGNEQPLRDQAVIDPPTTAIGRGPHIHRRISWGAIIGGVILVVTIQLLFSLLGAGIGLDTLTTNGGTTPEASTLGMGAGMWWIASSIISLAFGGYATAWMAGVELRWDGVLHGMMTWGIATLLTIWLLSSAIGGVIGGGASALGGLASAAGSGIKNAAQPVAQATRVTPDLLQQQAQAFLQPARPDPANMSPQAAQKEIATSLAIYGKGGPDAQDARARIVAIVAAQQHISPDQAAQQFDQTQARLQLEKAQAIETARNTADATATTASQTSFAAFGDLLIGLLAAAIGGSLAVQRRTLVTQRVGR